MSIETLSNQLLSKVNSLNKDLQNLILDPNNPPIMNTETTINLEKLESKFNGDVRIIVTDSPVIDELGPCTIPAHNTLINWNSIPSALKSVLSRIKLLKGTDVKVEKTGDSFRVTSSEQVFIYVPRWFLTNNDARSPINFKKVPISDDARVGILLHELGHWDSTNSMFTLFGTLATIIGSLLVFISFFLKKEKYVIKEGVEKNQSTEVVVEKNIHPFILAISGVIFYAYGSTIFGSFAEAGSDKYAARYGYGKELSKYIEDYLATQADTTKNLKSIFGLIHELIIRARTGYPSIDWRVRDLLNFNENEEYITELSFWPFNNMLEETLIKLNNIVEKLPPLSKLRVLKFHQKSINENINMLIIDTFHKI